MDRARRDDPAALDALLAAYWRPLVRYARGFVESRDAAEDVVQESFIAVWDRRLEWRAGSLAGLLYRATRNRALNERRRERVRREWRIVAPVDEAPSPWQTLQDRELGECLERAIEALPPRRREIFLLARVDGLVYREIAEVLGISAQTVANQMSAALAELRRALSAAVGRSAEAD
ncbi:MAG TPA: RNA polymerase sigma-70 factor [Longimicrobiales bacterium]|nr:RNA polymerase sigma-70 factor [Longimicrobiales bacterium]